MRLSCKNVCCYKRFAQLIIDSNLVYCHSHLCVQLLLAYFRNAQAARYSFHTPMPFHIGNTFLSDRHLKLAGYLSLYRSRYEKAGLLDLNLADSPMTQQYRTGQELLRNGALDIAEVQILNWAAKYLELCDLEK